MNKLFLPVCLLVAGSTSAISETLKTLSAQEPTKALCERLSTDDKAAFDDFCSDMEMLTLEKRREMIEELSDLIAKHQRGAQVAKEILDADQILPQINLVTMKNQPPMIDFMEDEDDIFDDIDDADDVRMVS